ncbi:LamB/YcsF family protein [Pollutimonas thiosulfatoxidans]|uniref:5-oxoprolinase subunit A n=1 Tax=Pollutimonas thiosulfatoxidans TaxID=2028345 RepID=A0A410GB92_9BURK|nr:5-oxoprolinase subunit PxpA [Pollutimonas thiosulfatoxidans]QAA93558.1 lactam utilization protein LamB [Pollutimonas thiosulfatoxidans]
MGLAIDLNCDMGESFGAWKMGQDEDILPYVTSANIACGFHAGDAATMRKTVAAALRHGVALGAHPGLPDLVGFGRRNMDVSAQDVYDIVIIQVGALAAVAASQGGKLHHVKAHGALYNMAARNGELATAIAKAVHDIDSTLLLYALAGSVQVKAAEDMGLAVAQEVFADRSYQSDGSLTPRKQAGAMIEDPAISIKQVLRMVQEGKVATQQGSDVNVRADTLCIHGDQPDAVVFAQAIRKALGENGVQVRAI